MVQGYKNTFSNVMTLLLCAKCKLYIIPSLLLFGWDFFVSIQPFISPCNYIGINQLREVIFKVIYICRFYHLSILLVRAILAETLDLNQIVSDGESLGRDILNTQRVQGTQGN